MSNGFDRGIGNKFKSAFLAKQLVNLIQSGKTPSQKQLNKVTSDPVANKIFQQGLASRVEQLKSKDTRGTTRKDSQPKPTTDSGVDTAYRQNMAAGAQALTKQLTQDQSEYKGMSKNEGTEAGLLSGAGAALPFFMAGGAPGIAAGLGAIAVGGIMGRKKAKAARQQFEREIAEKRRLIDEEREEQRKQNYYNRRQAAFNNLMQSLNQAMS